MRHLRDVAAGQLQHEDVALAAVPVRLEGDASPIRRDGGLGIVVGAEGELLGGATLHGQTEQVAEHREDQPLAVG